MYQTLIKSLHYSRVNYISQHYFLLKKLPSLMDLMNKIGLLLAGGKKDKRV
jgi:hypothetical protein